jgi:hypothetical protein
MALFLCPEHRGGGMDSKTTDPASPTCGEHGQEQEDAADREKRELALLLSEVEERPADEAGYGHGV